MKISSTPFRGTSIALGLALAVGCASEPADEDIDFIESSVEDEFGGLDMEDEAPLFGDQALYEELDLTADEAIVADDFATDADVIAATTDATAVIDDVVILWGGGDLPVDWSGSIEVSDGVMLATRSIRFEGNDGIDRRTDRRRVDFRSRTLRHRDGLRLRLAAAADSAAGRTLTYRINGDEYVVDLDRLLDTPEARDVGTRGDRIVVVAHRRPVDACDNGFLRGHWLQMGRGFGVLRGIVTNSDGDGVGHIRGIYGVRRSGERIFFGKYINRAGEFKGIFRGTYRSGHFVGRWLHRGGDHGVLGGVFRESLAGDRHGGGFAGRWAETSCDARIPSDLPADR